MTCGNGIPRAPTDKAQTRDRAKSPTANRRARRHSGQDSSITLCTVGYVPSDERLDTPVSDPGSLVCGREPGVAVACEARERRSHTCSEDLEASHGPASSR
jgi:hypothetical protein